MIKDIGLEIESIVAFKMRKVKKKIISVFWGKGGYRVYVYVTSDAIYLNVALTFVNKSSYHLHYLSYSIHDWHNLIRDNLNLSRWP